MDDESIRCISSHRCVLMYVLLLAAAGLLRTVGTLVRASVQCWGQFSEAAPGPAQPPADPL